MDHDWVLADRGDGREIAGIPRHGPEPIRVGSQAGVGWTTIIRQPPEMGRGWPISGRGWCQVVADRNEVVADRNEVVADRNGRSWLTEMAGRGYLKFQVAAT